jgi:hypothetical protein
MLILGVGFSPIAFIMLRVGSPRNEKYRPTFNFLAQRFFVGVQRKIGVGLRWFAGIAVVDRMILRCYLKLSG